jgi:thiamine transport system permease protein
MVIDAKRYRHALMGGALALGFILFLIVGAVSALLSYDVGERSENIVSPYFISILRFTLYQAVLSTLLSVVLAMPVALALARQPRFWGRIWVIRLFAVPMGLPVIVGTLGIITIWGQQGVLNKLLLGLGADGPISIYGLSGILLAHVFFNLPLATRLLLAALERIPVEYWRTSAALGMRPLAIFRLIEWPAMRPAVLSSATLVFMLCLTSFTIVLLLGGGPAATTIEVAIYQALRFDFDPQRAILLATIQIGLTVLLLGLTALVPIAEDDARAISRVPRRFDGLPLGVKMKDACAILFTVVFVASPLLAVVASGVSADLWRLLTADAFLRAFVTSFSIAISAAFMAVSVSLLICHARYSIGERRQLGIFERGYRAILGSTPSLVLLVPPVVIGSGWFLLLHAFGEVDRYAPFLVAFINMLISLPFVMRVIEPAYLNYRLKTDRLSASLGLSGFGKLRIITWPLLRRALAMAMSFSIALSLGDLGAVALFGSEDFVTLPWLVYSNMGSYRSADAAGYALILGLICLLLAIYGAGYDKPQQREDLDRDD